MGTGKELANIGIGFLNLVGANIRPLQPSGNAQREAMMQTQLALQVLPIAGELSIPEDALKLSGALPLGEELSGRVSKAIEAADAGIERYPGKDGIVFENRERLLPAEPYGYYKEYTVDPVGGVSGRGVERIVTGQRGEVYYTNFHYQGGTFVRIR